MERQLERTHGEANYQQAHTQTHGRTPHHARTLQAHSMNAVQLEGDIARESLEVAWGLGDGPARNGCQGNGAGWERREEALVQWHLPAPGRSQTCGPVLPSMDSTRVPVEWSNLCPGTAEPVRPQGLDPFRELGGHIWTYLRLRVGRIAISLSRNAPRSVNVSMRRRVGPGRFSKCRLAPASNLASMFVRVCWTVYYPHPPPSKREFWRCTLHVRTKIVFQGKPW